MTALVGALLLISGNKVGSQTPTASETHHRFDQQIALVLKKEKQGNFPDDVSNLLGLTQPNNAHWSCKGDARQKNSDQTHHAFLISLDGKKDIVLVFKPADKTHNIYWRTDADGRLLSTVFADPSAVRLVPNSEYARQFEDEKAYWDSLIPHASPTPSASPTG